MNEIKFDRLKYSVKITIGNTYIIYPHNCLKAKYSDDKCMINIVTIGSNNIILSFNKDKLTDIYYKDRFMDKVDYVNKQL